MKYLVVLLVIVAVIWIVRSSTANREGHARNAPPPRRPPGPPALPQDMVMCPVCSVHLPRNEALPGPDGQMYCCPEHRARAAG